MAPYRRDYRPSPPPAARGTLAHFGGGEGIYPDDVERDDMPPAKRPPSGTHSETRRFRRGREPALRRGRPDAGHDGEDDWHRGMRGQGTGGYGGQYAGMAAGLRGRGQSTRADRAEMVGSYGESGGSYRARDFDDSRRRDERIRDDICERLRRDEVRDAGNIRVRVEGGLVELEGTVRGRWAKRRAEDLAMVNGVRAVNNNLRVDQGWR